MLSRVISELAGDEPAAVLLIGGGSVSREEIVEHLRRRRAVVIVEGTGRLADEIAAGLSDDKDGDLRALVMAGDVQRVPLGSGATAIAKAVKRALTRPRRPLDSVSSWRRRSWGERRERWVALSVFPRWPYRPGPPQPLVDPDARVRFPLLASRISVADEVVYPAYVECEKQAGIEQNRYRWFAVLAIFGGLLTTVFGAVQAWLQSTQWPGVVVATLGAATTALNTIARRQGSREEYLKARMLAERLRSVYFQQLATPPAPDDGHDEASRRALALQVAKIRYGTELT
jgi:hypothetical protein